MIFSEIIPFKISNIFTPFKTSESSLGIYSVQLNTFFECLLFAGDTVTNETNFALVEFTF